MDFAVRDVERFSLRLSTINQVLFFGIAPLQTGQRVKGKILHKKLKKRLTQ